MNKNQAKSICLVLHSCLDKNRFIWYSLVRMCGHDLLDSTSQLEQCGWDLLNTLTDDVTRGMDKKAAALFRDMANALDASD